jgi:signal transduction histidine kinase
MNRHRVLSSAGVRFTAIYFALYLASTALMLASIYWIDWSSTRGQLDAQIDDRIEWLNREFAAGGVDKLLDDIRSRIRSQIRTRIFYRLARGAQVVVTNFPDAPQPRIQLGRQSLTVSEQQDGASAFIELRARTVRLADALMLTVGVDGEPLVSSRQLFLRVAFGVLLGSLLMAPLIGYVMSRNLLNQLSSLNRTISSIMAGELSRRVHVRGTNDEFDQLGNSLNEMLETIQRLMSDLRSTANDVAHDLRTPLSRLRMRLEELRYSGTASADVEKAIEECSNIIETFNAILKIAEIESEQALTRFAEVSLSDVTATIAEAYSAAAEEEEREFHVDVQPAISAFGDKHLLLQMLSNLLENALKHTPRGTPVRLQLTIENGSPVLVVEDAGAGVPDHARERVFERFFRTERSRTTPGSGLGLALVAAIARLHHIRIELSDARPGLRVRLSF